jgi:hypothetical protein
MSVSKARERTKGTKASERLMALEVNGQRVTIDHRAMTMRERQTLRAELAKLPVEPDELDWVTGAVWIALRRDDAELTFEQVCDSITVGDMQARTLVDAEVDSPEA